MTTYPVHACIRDNESRRLLYRRGTEAVRYCCTSEMQETLGRARELSLVRNGLVLPNTVYETTLLCAHK